MSIMQTIQANRANRRPSFVRPGGSSNELQKERRDTTRQQYFGGRKDIPDTRLDKRYAQAEQVKRFKDQYTKPVGITDPLTGKPTGTVGGSNVYQMTPDAPMSLRDFQMQTANRFGPTLGEIGSDVSYNLGNITKGLGNFIKTGGIPGQIVQSLKNLVTPTINNAKAIADPIKDAAAKTFYGVSDSLKGYDTFTKKGIGETPEITTQSLPSFDLEDKMSAFEDSVGYYNRKQGGAKETMVADAGSAVQNYMDLLRNIQNIGNTSYGDFGVENILSSPTFTYEKQLGPGNLDVKIGDNKGSIGYNMIFNKGGRVRGTGIMGAL
jgi:hypothetical protein